MTNADLLVRLKASTSAIATVSLTAMEVLAATVQEATLARVTEYVAVQPQPLIHTPSEVLAQVAPQAAQQSSHAQLVTALTTVPTAQQSSRVAWLHKHMVMIGFIESCVSSS